ncbi:hypothetical protein DSECCO2_493250 [anaerobic digester metagenome]
MKSEDTKNGDIRWYIETSISIIGLIGIPILIKEMEIIYTNTWIMSWILIIMSIITYCIVIKFKAINILFITHYGKRDIEEKEEAVYNVLSLVVYVGLLLIYSSIIRNYCKISHELLWGMGFQAERIMLSNLLIISISIILSIITFLLIIQKIYKDRGWVELIRKYYTTTRCITVIIGIMLSVLVIINYYWI